MSPMNTTRRQSLMDFERFCQAQKYDITRELNESAQRVGRYQRLGSALTTGEMQDGMTTVEVRR